MPEEITGLQIRVARTMLNLTLRQLANSLGRRWNQSILSQIESGKKESKARCKIIRQFFEQNGLAFSPDGKTVYLILRPVGL